VVFSFGGSTEDPFRFFWRWVEDGEGGGSMEVEESGASDIILRADLRGGGMEEVEASDTAGCVLRGGLRRADGTCGEGGGGMEDVEASGTAGGDF